MAWKLGSVEAAKKLFVLQNLAEKKFNLLIYTFQASKNENCDGYWGET
jgi:hypothetical protein